MTITTKKEVVRPIFENIKISDEFEATFNILVEGMEKQASNVLEKAVILSLRSTYLKLKQMEKEFSTDEH